MIFKGIEVYVLIMILIGLCYFYIIFKRFKLCCRIFKTLPSLKCFMSWKFSFLPRTANDMTQRFADRSWNRSRNASRPAFSSDSKYFPTSSSPLRQPINCRLAFRSANQRAACTQVSQSAEGFLSRQSISSRFAYRWANQLPTCVQVSQSSASLHSGQPINCRVALRSANRWPDCYTRQPMH